MGVAAQAGDFLARWIEDDRDGQAEYAHLACDLLVDVAVLWQVADALFVEEALDRLRRIAACSQCHDLECIAAELGLQVLQRRHFFAAGRTPCGPEVQQHVLAGVVRQAGFRFVRGQEGGRGGLYRRIVDHQAAHIAGQQRVEVISGGSICTEAYGKVSGGDQNFADHFRPFHARQMHMTKTGSSDKQASTANTMWGGRFAAGPDAIMEAINASIRFDQRMARQDIEGSRAHAAMLAATGIVRDNDAETIREGLLTVLSEIEGGDFAFSTALEDIHMNVEARLKEIVGEPAGRLHTARSRNDQVATDFRLWVRDQVDAAIAGVEALQRALLGQAEQGADWVMPGFTHLQTAQPVTWGHHMMAYVEMFGRDAARLRDARVRMNESPLGAAALAGTSFPIDREMTAKALGFDRPCANSLDAVSDRDFALEFLSAASICAMHLSRLAEELVIWSSAQFRFVALSDRFSTGSSIMPQKKNPDAAELIRAKIGRIFGANVALMTVMKGLALTYSKDMQEDKEQVFDAADNLMLALAAMEGMVGDMQARVPELEAAAASGFSTATDLADWLVRALDMPFRDAHHVTGSLVKLAEDKRCDLPDLTLADMQSVHGKITDDVFAVLGVHNSVASRTSYGGTSPVRVREQIARWRDRIG